MLEFHDCEINYNSIKSGLSGALSNQTGFSPSYTIDINYADCYEVSYNDIMMRKIGDVILTDLVNGSKIEGDYASVAQNDNAALANEVKYRTEPYTARFLGTAINQLAGHITADMESLFNRAILGNIYTYSLTQIASEVDDLLKGNLIKTGMTIKEYVKESQNRKRERELKATAPNGNIYEDDEEVEKPKRPANSTINTGINIDTKKPSGNIFNKSTIANNI